MDGTPDGKGNDGTDGMLTDGIAGTAGTVKSLGKGGTAGTAGTVGAACALATTSLGAIVSVPITFPSRSTVAMTSTTTVRTGGADSACRR